MRLNEARITVTESVDCCGPSKTEFVSLTVTTHDGGGGKYIAINTKRFAFSSRKEWIAFWDKYIQPLIIPDDHTP